MINKVSAILSEEIKLRLNSSDNEKEIYAYSIEVILSLLINFIILAITAYILKKPAELIIFLIFFSGLRIYAGGYHAKTHIECISISFVIFIISSLSNNIFKPYSEILLLTGIAFSVFMVFVYAPAETENKPLSKEEQIKYRKFSRIIVLTLSVVAIILYFMRATTNHIFITAVVSMIIESISLLKK
ncbi:MAG: accessory regulator AgrB [Bacillota bacterium]|jgi:accessory gene regulator B|nr:accessory regulator AgrB [Bacillota bacterium]MDF2948385.1 accessory regulator AgrB [Sedimentibacter sp.]